MVQQHGRHVVLWSDTQLTARELSERAINVLHEQGSLLAKSESRCVTVSGVKLPNWFSLTPRDQITPHRRYRKSK